MCEACWVDEGRSTDLPPNGEAIVDDIRLLYSLNKCDTGGPLHVKIDDFNIEGTWRPFREEKHPNFYPEEAYVVAQRICDAMNPLPEPQRAAVVARWEGWF